MTFEVELLSGAKDRVETGRCEVLKDGSLGLFDEYNMLHEAYGQTWWVAVTPLEMQPVGRPILNPRIRGVRKGKVFS